MDEGPETRLIDFRFVRPPGREYVYTARLIGADASILVLDQVVTPSSPLLIDGNEVLAAGYRAVWFLFQGAPYDVARVYRPGGEWTGYYVDVLEPVHWTGADPPTLEPIVDLFLDLWVSPDSRYWVLDEDEFEAAARSGILTDDQACHAHDTLAACIGDIARGDFPPAVVRNFD